MIFSKRCFPSLKDVAVRCLQSKTQNVQEMKNNVKFLCKYLNICEKEAQYLVKKRPVIAKLNEERIKRIFECLHEIGLSNEVLVKESALFGIRPITIKCRHKILKECGIENVTSALIANYLKVMKKTTIGELKKSGYIPAHVNVENRLASHMTQWPTSYTTLIYEEVNKITLYNLRLKILQRYLELVLDLTNEEFNRTIKIYRNIIHRPLEYINETLVILRSQVMMPNYKIKSNLYLIHADPENLKNIIHNIQRIGGIDVREVIKVYPYIALKNCQDLMEIRKVLEEYDISNEAQRRCFNIYILGSKSVRERLEKAKLMPEFNIYFKHPSFLKLIYYSNTAMKRLNELNKNNKKCMSLNILSGSLASYQAFENSSGDKLGKGRDLIFCISEALGRKFKQSQIREIVQRHPFWIFTPPIQVNYTYKQLSALYTDQDIFENCPILLYPWQKIKDTLNMLQKERLHEHSNIFHENFNFSLLNNSQKLNLVIYILERSHNFSGNGVLDEKK